MKTNKIVITQEQFDAYENVRMSGVTNMFDVYTVSELSGLFRDEILEIMSDYTRLSKKY